MTSFLSAIVALTVVAAAAAAQAGKTAADGVYSQDQSTRGQALADKMCSSCHGDTLGGTAMAPPLSGQDFLSGWNDRTMADLNEKIQTTMPADSPGTLTPQQTVDLIAFLLKSSNFPAGSTELAPGAGLADIRLRSK
jgi:mono/diheme cytochrome c family protein